MNLETNLNIDFVDSNLFPVLPFENSPESLESYTRELFKNKKKVNKTIQVLDESEIY